MSDIAASSLGNIHKLDREANGGGNEEIRWVVVEKTMGLLPAKIIADRLISEGLLARAWQEGAGQALGLTVGILGEGRVVVPEDQKERALEILAEAAKEPIEWEIDGDDNWDEEN